MRAHVYYAYKSFCNQRKEKQKEILKQRKPKQDIESECTIYVFEIKIVVN